MHQLERETYDDAFLNEAMEGYEELADDDHEETLTDLKKQLHKRATKEKKGVFLMWRLLPIAASVLVLLGAGYWFLMPDAVKNQNVQSNQNVHAKLKDYRKQLVVNKPAPQKITPKEHKLIAEASIEPIPIKEPELLKEVAIAGNPSIKYKTDTVEYIASDYKVRSNASVDEMLKKAEGFEVSPDGSVTFNGTTVSKARLNGKDYTGGDVAKAVQSLPADIIEKFQVVDDYGNQAGRTGIKNGDPNKVLNLTTRNNQDKGYVNSGIYLRQATNLNNMPLVVYKKDTVEYTVNKTPIRENSKVDYMLRRTDGFEVNSDGSTTFNGKPIKRVKVNGKNYLGSLQKAIIELPADILDKIQVIDDYGDTASRTSIKIIEPEPVLNLIIRDVKYRRLPTTREISGVMVPGDTTAKPLPLIGWRKYAAYIKQNAVSPDGKTGEVSLEFNVAPNGKILEIKITSGFGVSYGRNTGSQIMNQKAMDMVQKGPKWRGDTKSKAMHFTINFR